jgi:hypothetical protein
LAGSQGQLNIDMDLSGWVVLGGAGWCMAVARTWLRTPLAGALMLMGVRFISIS